MQTIGNVDTDAPSCAVMMISNTESQPQSVKYLMSGSCIHNIIKHDIKLKIWKRFTRKTRGQAGSIHHCDITVSAACTVTLK